MTVERLENEMSADELDDWIEFYSLEPFGDEERMSDRRNGLLCAMTVNSSMGGGESKPSDFEFYSNKNENSSSGLVLEEMTDEEIKAAQSAIFLIMTAQ